MSLLLKENANSSWLLQGGFRIEKLFCCHEIFKHPKIEEWCTQNLGISNMVRVTENVYRKISYRKKTEGIVALVKKKKMDIDSIVFKNKNPLVLVAENIEKPGNIGAMLRTADASKIDCLLIAEPQTDMYNPNVIRSSVGGFFSVPIGVGTNEDIIHF